MNRVRQWRRPTGQKRLGWGVGQSEIHSSLLLTLFLLSMLTLCISYMEPGYQELRTAAVTIPLVWLASLTFRLAAQQLAIGDFAHEAGTTVCPTGNIQTDYEYLPPKAAFAYGISGQLASIALMSIGLVVNAAIQPETSGAITVYELLDFKGGWDSQAWATQIFWVNLLLVVMNLLPTVPFDMRAMAFATFSVRTRGSQEPSVFRKLGQLDSHLAAILVGVGVTAVMFGVVLELETLGWTSAAVLACYLVIASQWEFVRAEELEDQYVPVLKTQSSTMHAGHGLPPGPHLGMSYGDSHDESVDFLSGNNGDQRNGEDGPGLHEDGFATDDLLPGLGFTFDTEGFRSPPAGDDTVDSEFEDEDGVVGGGDRVDEFPPVDVDEILRKVHRDGVRSLTEDEHRTLLNASEQLKERRGLA
ncbi:MAG: hypothetical protein AAGG44_18665 [Planctomycetota bacterium]